MSNEKLTYYNAAPVGRLGIIPLKSCTTIGSKVDDYLVQWRRDRESDHKTSSAVEGYERSSYIIPCDIPRFGSGEAKGVIVASPSAEMISTFWLMSATILRPIQLCGHENHMSPDDHFQDLKRIIAAVGGKARRINVIMPFLYESRQHKRSGRESLDCAIMLQELVSMGVENIITFDAHDPRVQNAIPLHGFETSSASYQFIKDILRHASRT